MEGAAVVTATAVMATTVVVATAMATTVVFEKENGGIRVRESR